MKQDVIREKLTEILDAKITIEELTQCVKTSKKGKAMSEDLIANEFLRASGSTYKMPNAVLNLFNQCLLHGVYPWTTSLVTLLHKKGCRYNPNNYRAIAVVSNLGKVFAFGHMHVTKGRRRLYSCFVDYAKAFNSVCYYTKCGKMGIRRRFFNCIQFMYTVQQLIC